MDFPGVIAELLALAGARQPTAGEIALHFTPRATARGGGNEKLTYPAWASGTRGRNDIFLSFDGDVQGIALWDDFRGWGAYAHVAVARGTLAELTPIIGTTSPVARSPGDFQSGEKLAAYVPREGKTVRIFVELARGETAIVRRVLMHFQTSP